MQVQHDIMVWLHSVRHPEPCPESSNLILNSFQDQGLRFRDLGFELRIHVLKPRPVGGVLFLRIRQEFV